MTPFRSQVQYLMDTKDTRTVTLLYSNKTASEIAYKNIFDTAEREIGMKTIYTSRIDGAMIAREVPDYKERTFYLSGPHGMVTAFEKTLHDMGVSRFSIKTDYFPGFA